MLDKLNEQINELLEKLVPIILQNFLIKKEDLLKEYVVEYPIYEEMLASKEYKYFSFGRDLPEDTDIRVRIFCQTSVYGESERQQLEDKSIKINREELLFLLENHNQPDEKFIDTKIKEQKAASQIKAVWRNFIKNKNKVQ